MINIVTIPLAWKYDRVPLSASDEAIWRDTQDAAFKKIVLETKDKLNEYMAKGAVVLASHLWETESDTQLVFVLYLSSDKVKVPF